MTLRDQVAKTSDRRQALFPKAAERFVQSRTKSYVLTMPLKLRYIHGVAHRPFTMPLHQLTLIDPLLAQLEHLQQTAKRRPYPLGTAKVEAMLGIQRGTLNRLKRQGKLPYRLPSQPVEIEFAYQERGKDLWYVFQVQD